MPMNKEEFKEGIRDLIEDVNDPNGDFAELRREFQEIHDEIVEHDQGLALKFQSIALAVEGLVEYVQARKQ